MGYKMSNNNPNYFMIKDSFFREWYALDKWITNEQHARRFNTKAEAKAFAQDSKLKNYVITKRVVEEVPEAFAWSDTPEARTRNNQDMLVRTANRYA